MSEDKIDRSEQVENADQEVQQQPIGEENTTEEEFEDAEDVLNRLQTELDEARNQALRFHAEMQNLRRRVERDVENAHKYALERFIGELLPVVDNLERAIEAIDKGDEQGRRLLEGIELTLKSFVDTLKRFNVEAVDPLHQTFNPELHQAMTTVEDGDVAPNTVLNVIQKGYTLNGRLVRPAMVIVSRAAKGK